jgi:hypothetical protein
LGPVLYSASETKIVVDDVSGWPYSFHINKGDTDMTSIINADTFEASSEQPDHGYWVNGTVEVTLRGKTARVNAHKRGHEITAFGMTGRYATGTKAWPASATRVIDPSTNTPWDRVSFGRDDRSSRFNKTSALSFA